MDASPSKEYGDFAKSLEDELMNCTGDYEDENFGTYFVETSEKIHKNSEPVEAEHSDTTECSTSFDDSDCGGVDASGEAEVLSEFGGAESASGNLVAKRRKLSSHWRAFIHPLMWRCKWVELQINKLDAKARAYDRKLQATTSEEVVWRKRRRRAEATNDVAAYMSRHNLFSYYEHRKYIREISHNVLKNHPAVDTREEVEELGNDEGGEHDKALEEILGKLEALQWRVRKLKSRVVKEEEEEEEELVWVQNGGPPSPTTTRRRMPVTTNYIASQLLAEYNLGGVLLSETTHHPPQNELVEEEDEDDVLIDNHRVREELRYFERVKKVNAVKRPCTELPNSNLSTQSKRGRRK